VRACERAEHAAQDACQPLELCGVDAGRAQRLRLFAGGPQPEAVGRLIEEQPQQQHEQQRQIDEQRVAAENFAEEGNALDARKAQAGQEGVALCAARAENGARQEACQAECERVERAADDEFIGAELHDEQCEEQADEKADADGQHHTGCRRGEQPAAEHAEERAHQDHAVHADVHDPGVLRQRAAEGGQRHGRGAAEHLLERSGGENALQNGFKHAFPPPFPF